MVLLDSNNGWKIYYLEFLGKYQTAPLVERIFYFLPAQRTRQNFLPNSISSNNFWQHCCCAARLFQPMRHTPQTTPHIPDQTRTPMQRKPTDRVTIEIPLQLVRPCLPVCPPLLWIFFSSFFCMYNHLWHLLLRTQLCRCNKRRCGSCRWFVTIPHDPLQILWQMILFFIGGLKAIAYVFFLWLILWPSFSKQRLHRPNLKRKFPASSPSIGDFATRRIQPEPRACRATEAWKHTAKKMAAKFQNYQWDKEAVASLNVNIQPSLSPDTAQPNCSFELRSILTWFTDQLPTCQDLNYF